MKRRTHCSAIIAMLIFSDGYAYEQSTHRTLTQAAVRASLLGDVNSAAQHKRARLDVRNDFYRNSKGKFKRSMVDLVEDGVDFEDDGMRSLNHFTDPRTMTGLAVNGASTSIDWALGTYGTFHFPMQSRSYVDLKRYYFQALTGLTQSERKSAMSLTFETLGHIVHHIQDAAQPQHTRNDIHVSDRDADGVCKVVTPATPELFLLCRFYAANRNPSFFEQWTAQLEKTHFRQFTLSGYAPVFDASGVGNSWPGTAERFFVGDGKGIAEYSNRNFLTTGTMGQGPPALGELLDVTVGALCIGSVPACGDVDPALSVRFWQSAVDDRLRTGVSPHPYAASSSILAPDFKAYAVDGVKSPMTVNRFTFEYDYAYLLPRAVGYSAGFINYFFRGDLDVALPNEGVFGAIDINAANCGSTCGFNRLKMKVRNSTPGEAMGKGNLYLVVRFRTNDCFETDLAGEDGGGQFHAEACRSLAPSFLVSKPIALEGLASEDYASVAFSFESPRGVPINASDLSLQLVFRGQLGMESDAIVVSTVDVSEPNYVAVGNLTDYVFYTGDDRYAPLKPGDSPIVLNKVTFSFQDPASSAPPLATLTGLTGGQHAQFAFITTKGTRNYWLRSESFPPFGATDNAPFRVEEFFKDDDVAGSIYARTCKVVKERDRYRQYTMYYAQSAHGRVSEIAPDGTRPTAVQQERERLASKYASDCKGTVDPGSNGMFDFSYLTPYTNANAKAWTINFP